MPVHPQVAQLLAQIDALGQPPVADMDPEQFRAAFRALATVGGGSPAAEGTGQPSTEEHVAPGPAGDIPLRVYRPGGAGPWPVVVFFHGGGWVIGDRDTHDGLCRHLCTGTPAVLISVDYRLAPEHPFPAAVEDAEAATRWAAANAAQFGADPARLAVAGDSAGGNLAAVVARRARDQGGPPIAFQLLLYPVTDLTRSHPSYVANGEGYLLTAQAMAWFAGHYLAGADPRNPDVSPLFTADLRGLPSAYVVTAEFDPLRDEGEAYAAALRRAGVDATAVRYDGMIHGFLSMDGLLDEARRALAVTVEALRAGLAPRRPSGAPAGTGEPGGRP